TRSSRCARSRAARGRCRRRSEARRAQLECREGHRVAGRAEAGHLPAPMDASMSEPGRVGERAGWACALVGGLGRALGRLPRALAGATAVGWMLLIWWLSSGPIDVKPPLPAPGFFWNLAHAPVFGLLAALTAAALAPRPLPASWPDPGRLARVAAFVVAVGWAALDELHQARVASRPGSLLDLVADATEAASA